MFANCKYEELSYLKKIRKSSCGTPPLAYYEEVPPPPAGVIVNSKLDYHPWPDPSLIPFLPIPPPLSTPATQPDICQSRKRVLISSPMTYGLKAKDPSKNGVLYKDKNDSVVLESLSFTAEGKRQIQVKNLSK